MVILNGFSMRCPQIQKPMLQSSILKMDTAHSTKKLVSIRQTTQHHIPEVSDLQMAAVYQYSPFLRCRLYKEDFTILGDGMMASGEGFQHNMGFRSQWEISVPTIHVVLVVSKMRECKVHRKISNKPNLSQMNNFCFSSPISYSTNAARNPLNLRSEPLRL